MQFNSISIMVLLMGNARSLIDLLIFHKEWNQLLEWMMNKKAGYLNIHHTLIYFNI